MAGYFVKQSFNRLQGPSNNEIIPLFSVPAQFVARPGCQKVDFPLLDGCHCSFPFSKVDGSLYRP
jgi:hypothetical protein